MILGNVLGDNNTNDCGKSKQECEDGSSKLVGNYVCTVCEEKERKIREFEQSCDFYKRKNGELTEQVKNCKIFFYNFTIVKFTKNLNLQGFTNARSVG